jgi:hypothetical protein
MSLPHRGDGTAASGRVTLQPLSRACPLRARAWSVVSGVTREGGDGYAVATEVTDPGGGRARAPSAPPGTRSDPASFVNGATMSVAGGRLAGGAWDEPDGIPEAPVDAAARRHRLAPPFRRRMISKLSVRGRRTGRCHTVPVAVLVHEDERYLVPTAARATGRATCAPLCRPAWPSRDGSRRSPSTRCPSPSAPRCSSSTASATARCPLSPAPCARCPTRPTIRCSASRTLGPRRDGPSSAALIYVVISDGGADALTWLPRAAAMIGP